MNKNQLIEEIAEARESVRNLADKFHIISPLVTMETKITDSRGKVLESTERLSKSWTRNGYNLLTAQLCFADPSQLYSSSVFGDGSISFKNYAGNLNSSTSYAFGFKAGTITLYEDLKIGTGTSAESIDSYELDTVIAGGSSTGQMNYQTPTKVCAWYSGSRTMRTVYTRAFVNESGGTINVSESGLYTYIGPTGSTSYSLTKVMVQRDVFTPDAVADGQTYTKTYTFDVVYPS